MKKSNYIIDFEREASDVWLFNLVTDSMFSLKNHVYNLLNENIPKLKEDYPSIFNSLVQNGTLIKDSTDELKLLKHLMYNKKYASNTLSLVVMLTHDCNFACRYCFEERNQKKMGDREICKLKKLINNQLNKFNNFTIGWFGGEPLLEIDTIEELGTCFSNMMVKNKKQLFQHINTNGSLLNKQNFIRLYDSGVKMIDITIDGPSKYHNKNRPFIGGKGSYDTIVNNLIEIVHFYPDKVKEVTISLKANIDKENINSIIGWLSDDIPNEIKEYIEIYFNPIAKFSTRKAPSNNLKSNELLSYNNLYEEVFQLMERAFNLGYNVAADIDNEFIGCPAESKNHYYVLPSCKVARCTVKMEEIGEISSEGNVIIDNIDSYIKWIQKDPFEFNKCRQCIMLPRCMGGCPNAFYSKNEPQCKMSLNAFKKYLSLYKKMKYKKLILS